MSLQKYCERNDGTNAKAYCINILEMILSIKVVAMCWIQSICSLKPMYAELRFEDGRLTTIDVVYNTVQLEYILYRMEWNTQLREIISKIKEKAIHMNRNKTSL